ncbi:uncharacterized protein LOC101476772 isoform X1 [Maylandia zebra]|uniref:uncharacterized protein LOC101476772 isoform X1 n=1 Tax=Maylandia zebra TaxID=106582 RepID=UPI00403D39D8
MGAWCKWEQRIEALMECKQQKWSSQKQYNVYYRMGERRWHMQVEALPQRCAQGIQQWSTHRANAGPPEWKCPDSVDGMREQTHGSVEDNSVSIEKSCACTVAKAKRPDWEYSIDATHSGTTYSTVNPLRFAQKLRQDPCKDPDVHLNRDLHDRWERSLLSASAATRGAGRSYDN